MTHQPQSVSVFLRLFGWPTVVFAASDDDSLHGYVAWDDSPTDRQEFVVDAKQRPLSADAVSLAEFLHEGNWIDIDRLKIPREVFQKRFIAIRGEDWTSKRFDVALVELLAFRVRMIDDGKETDCFFLHE